MPILHTEQDMGSLSGAIQETYLRRFGEKRWKEHTEAIREMWTGLGRKIRALDLPYKKVKVYQDGLPVCGKESEIIEELAERGSPNHKLVRWLMRRGATLVGTEDPELLVREYNHLRAIAHSGSLRERDRLMAAFEREAAELKMKRDRKIRDRIVETLNPGEIGVLFIGFLHRVDEMIPHDIDVRHVIYRLPFRSLPS